MKMRNEDEKREADQKARATGAARRKRKQEAQSGSTPAFEPDREKVLGAPIPEGEQMATTPAGAATGTTANQVERKEDEQRPRQRTGRARAKKRKAEPQEPGAEQAATGHVEEAVSGENQDPTAERWSKPGQRGGNLPEEPVSGESADESTERNV